jgi:MFS family permease
MSRTMVPVAPTKLRSNVTHRIYAARALRDFGDGFVAILLPVYLSNVGMDAFGIGLTATLALLGSASMTLAIGLWGARIDQRTLLIAAAFLMTGTGIAFALSSTAAIVLMIAFFGTINPSSGSVSIFVPLEHAQLSHAVRDADRTHMFARYSLIGSLAAAVGALVSGAPEFLEFLGISRLTSLQLMFILYAVLGLLGGALYAGLPSEETHEEAPKAGPLGPSKRVVYKLAGLFSIDAFAGGFAVQSLLALWLFQKFGLSLAAAGVFFFWSSVLSAFSFPVAAWLARHIGLVNTMVYTHIPSSLCFILAAIVPNVEAALVLLSVRAALSQMDVPTRSSYVMAVVTPPERAAAASVTSVPRSLAASLSPALAGALFVAGFEAWPFIICGVLKILYDITLLWTFRHVRPPEEQARHA